MDQSDADWGDWSLNNESGEMQSVLKGEVNFSLDNVEVLGPTQQQQDDADVSSALGDGREELCWDEGGSEMDSAEEAEQEATVPQSQYTPSKAKKGLVECEYCGRFGVKDAFYSKSKLFCSRACASSFTKLASSDPSILAVVPNVQTENVAPSPDQKTKVQTQNEMHKSGVSKTFVWNNYLSPSTMHAAPVQSFRHCPMWSCWEHICVGLKLEVVNCHAGLANHSAVYWVASIIRLEGYRGLMRYEGFGQDCAHDFWLNLCSCDVHPVGWCAANHKPLVPPKVIQNKYSDWREVLVRRLTGARTLPRDFSERVSKELTSWPLVPKIRLEVVDKMCVSAMRVAAVQETVCGRVKLQYQNDVPSYDNDTFWCHSHSMLIHPVGWSRLVGHKLHASQEYKGSSLEKAISDGYEALDAAPVMFPKPGKVPHSNGDKFRMGMKLEAIDPLNLSAICVATVMKVLRHDYLMIGIDGSMAANGSDWFCYHASSSSIFPVGFCKINNIQLTPPRGYKGPFRWLNYLRETKSVAAPVQLFNKEIPNHGFRPGMKLETVDLMEPRLICVSTVARVVGRLLCIHFDGWDDSYNQWVDCTSPDIYPVGWCEMVGYHLEGPRALDAAASLSPGVAKKRRYKPQSYRGLRKKRRRGGQQSVDSRLQLQSGGIDSLSDLSQDSFQVPDKNAPTTPSSAQLQVDTEPGQGAIPDHLSSASSMPVLSPSTTPPALSIKPQTPPIQRQAPPLQQLAPPLQPAAPPTTSQLSSSLPNITNMLNFPVASMQPATSPRLTTPPPSGGALELLTSSTSPLLGVSRVTTHNTPRVDEKSKPSQVITPHRWSVFDVCQFLRINDCASHCDAFRKKGIDGPAFLALSKEMIVNLTGMKVGPSLKIYDLIQALKIRLIQQQQKGAGQESFPSPVTQPAHS